MKKRAITFLCIFMICLLNGCASKQKNIDLDIPVVVVTTGFAEKELFRIENLSCSLEEYMVYLTNIQNEYEEIYGSGIWDKVVDGKKLEDEVEDIALARISQIKAMQLMAENRGVLLNDDELQLATDLGQKYFETLNTKEVETLNITVDMIIAMCREYMLAEKLYETIIVDVNLEISDDEAREVTVLQIMVPTVKIDEDGTYHAYSIEEHNAAKDKIEEAYRALKGEESFDYVASIYNESEEITQVYDRKSAGEKLEPVIFDLAKGETSEIVETEKGYYIFQCVDTNDESKTEENKLKILDERRRETFTREYKNFINQLIINLNQKLWEKVEMIDDKKIVTNQFFTILGEQSFEITDDTLDGEE